MEYLSRLNALRKERSELFKELSQLTVGAHDHSNAKDGVDYKYMRAVRIQSINREIEALKRANIKVVTCLSRKVT